MYKTVKKYLDKISVKDDSAFLHNSRVVVFNGQKINLSNDLFEDSNGIDLDTGESWFCKKLNLPQTKKMLNDITK